MAKNTNLQLGNLIKSKREYLNITQQEVANYVGVSKSAVSRWESGDIGNMGIDKIPKLSPKSFLQVYSPLQNVDMLGFWFSHLYSNPRTSKNKRVK